MNKASKLLVACVISAIAHGCSSNDGDPTNPFPVSDDTTPPANVSGFSATPGNESVILSWDAATDDQGISGYRIRLTSPVFASSAIGTTLVVDAATLTVEWTGLEEGVSYTFEIVAVDTSNNLSGTPAVVTSGPAAPDVDAPAGVSGLSGAGGYNDPVARDFVRMNIAWSPSVSPDVSHYLLCVGTSPGICDIVANVNVGTISALTIPNDPGGPITSADLGAALEIDTDYTIRVIAVDTSGNQSSPVSALVTPTISQDNDPPDPVQNLSAQPENQAVTLSWIEPQPVGDANQFAVYVRELGNPETSEWYAYETTTAFTSTVDIFEGAPLQNGQLYEFMVAAIDDTGNETEGGLTAGTGDDEAAKVTAIPSSNLIGCTPSVEGGVFRVEYFDGRELVIMVSATQDGILTSTDQTAIYYTLDGSQVDTTIGSGDVTQTMGRHSFAGPRVTEVEPGRLYAVRLDIDPTVAGTQTIFENTLRPDGAADHILLEYQIVTPTDASRIFSETYLVYPNLANDSFLKFSGTRFVRSFPTLTPIETGNTAGDLIFAGGTTGPFNLGSTRDTGSRYRVAFEHFEPFDPGGTSATLGETRSYHQATLLRDGETILYTGGFNLNGLAAPVDGAGNETLGLNSTDTFDADASADGFTAGGNMDAVRSFHSATRLFVAGGADARVFIYGGLNGETNVWGSIATPETVVQPPGSNASPTPGALSFDSTALGVPFTANLEGGVIEKIGAGNVIYDTGVITNQRTNGTDPTVIDLTIQGLVFSNVPGDEFRVIRGPISTGEFFTAAGANGGAPAGSGAIERYGHTSTLLQDGTVFIAGGAYDYSTNADSPRTDGYNEYLTEIYDPRQDQFISLGRVAELPLTTFFHTATLLRDGKVLLCGGIPRGDYMYRSNAFAGGTNVSRAAYLFDPFSRSMTQVGNMTSPRFFHGASMLPNGKVLIVGGYTNVDSDGFATITDTAEIYDPDTRTFEETGSMNTLRGPCATATISTSIANTNVAGKVLVAGGSVNTLAELYNPSTGQFEATAHSATYDRFVGGEQTMLTSGEILVTGGQETNLANQVGAFLDKAEIYDSSQVRFVPLGATMLDARRHHRTTLLEDGRVLITGGENASGGLNECEIYDPEEETFTQVSSMTQKRYKHTATLLRDGRVFVCGGANVIGPLRTCEIYDPATLAFVSVPSMSVGRFDHTATLLPNGWVLITGGESIDDTSVEVFDPVAEDFITFNADTMFVGRDGHSAYRPRYWTGRARFRNGSPIVRGSEAGVNPFGLESTSWAAAGVRPGDVIISENDARPYVIGTVANFVLTLADDPDIDYDDSGYGGDSTSQVITENNLDNEFEYYTIYSQDVYIVGGEITTTDTEVLDFDVGDDDFPGADPADSTLIQGGAGAGFLNTGRFGHALAPLSDWGLVLAGSDDQLDGEYVPTTPPDFSGDVWTSVTLDPATEEIEFPIGFTVRNGQPIFVHQHSARAFFHE